MRSYLLALVPLSLLLLVSKPSAARSKVMESPLILTLEPETALRVRKLLSYAKTIGVDLRIISARRTCAEQNSIYAQGRTTPGKIVTNAPGCRSWHVWGRAADFVIISNGKAVWDSPIYARLGAKWETMGGKWGGRFKDPGHFEYHPGLTIEQVCPDSTDCEGL